LTPRAGGRKAFAEGEKQLRAAFHANFSPEQCRDQAPLLREKAEPGVRVGRDVDVRRADKAILHVEHAIADRDRHVALFGARKREVEGRLEPARLVWLEDIGHKVEQPGDRARPETVAYGLHRLVFEFSPGYRFGVRARHDVDWLGTFLQRLDNLLEVPL